MTLFRPNQGDREVRAPAQDSRQLLQRSLSLASPSVLVPIAAFTIGLLSQLLNPAHLPFLLMTGLDLVLLAFVFWTVFVTLRHAEAVAARVGEPIGTLVLTLAITAIEASIIVSVMLHGEPNPTLARESVFSTVMIVTAGVIGICLTFGGWRHRHQELKREGTNALLAVVIALTVLTLVLPDFTLAGTGAYSPLQLAFVSLLCVLLYVTFVLAQMTRNRDDFVNEERPVDHAQPSRRLPRSLALLLLGLVGVVLVAEHIAANLETGLESLRVPQLDAIVGAFIAALVLLPETVSAIRAAMGNDLQRSLNIALGSACATIGLTIPIVGAVSLATGSAMTLGLEAGDIVLLLLALAISMLSFGTGRTTALTGAVHLVIFVAFLLLIAVP